MQCRSHLRSMFVMPLHDSTSEWSPPPSHQHYIVSHAAQTCRSVPSPSDAGETLVMAISESWLILYSAQSQILENKSKQSRQQTLPHVVSKHFTQQLIFPREGIGNGEKHQVILVKPLPQISAQVDQFFNRFFNHSSLEMNYHFLPQIPSFREDILSSTAFLDSNFC